MSNAGFVLGGICVVGFGVAVVTGIAIAMPQYHVYQQKLVGEAELARASQNKQIMVQQAQAELDAAKLRSQAIQVIGQAAKDFPEYRHQEFIGAFADALKEGKIDQIIYVPTEANIPIIEAGKRSN